MGFFSKLLTGGLQLAGQFLGAPAAPVARAPTSRAEARLPVAITAAEGREVGTRARRPGERIPVPPSAERRIMELGEPSGRLRKRTIVETFDPVTGVVTRSRTTPGGVAVFAQDVAAARRINRQVRKLDARLPRKTVKQSPVKQLTDRVIKNALERAGDDPCPK